MHARLSSVPRRQQLAYVLIATGIAAGAAAFVLWRQQPKPPAPQSPDTNHSAPSAHRPSQQEISSYTVAPTLPRFITIPAINVPKTRVRILGLTKNNQIAVPDNIYDTGWFEGSAKPGQAGAMFIYGHVSSWQANGIFYNLHKLKPGDNVTVTRGDNKTFTYQVVSSKIYPYNNVNMHEVLSPIKPGTPGLNLMTCTGKVIKGTSEFNERLVVFTRQTSGQ